MRTLAEDLLLLGLDDDKGTVSWQHATAFPYGLGGALLIDLARQGRIDTVDDKIVVTDPTPTGDDVLDEALQTIQASKKPRDARHWVGKLGGRKGLKEQLARRLVERGILREEEHKFLWIFQSPRFPTSDPGPEASLRGQIRDVVLAGIQPDERLLLLLSLIKATDLTNQIFERGERRQAKRRIKELVEGEEFGRAVGKAVADATTAVVIAASAAAITASTAASSSN
ncbi:MAG TPA: GPP34 family phosphoprotein [Thermomicrobiales bacterium]|nr:GPP34 family phosphoprotein [Thermomicrobiales bacterium]